MKGKYSNADIYWYKKSPMQLVAPLEGHGNTLTGKHSHKANTILALIIKIEYI
jgi:hypothetical protein